MDRFARGREPTWRQARWSARRAVGRCSAKSASRPCRKMPAFSKAMAPSVRPSMAVWSWLIEVMMLTSGSVAFVASSRPPRPTSTTAISHPWRAKKSSASAVVTSNVVGSPAARGRSRTKPRMRSTASLKSHSEMARPSTRTRSRYVCKCGLVYRPQRTPAAERMLASVAQVEPLPFVPATSAIRNCRSGAPARSSSARVRPSFHWLSGLARGFQPTPRSWSARL